MFNRLLNRPRVNDAVKFRFQRRLLDRFYFDTGGSFDRFYNRRLDLLDGRCGGNFQQLQQRGIDARDRLNRTWSPSPLAQREHIKLVSDFFESPKSFTFEF